MPVKLKCNMPWTKRRSYLVDILSLAFGLGAWVSVTGFWVELPLLIDHLPEGWRVSSQLSVAIQLANVGPLVCALFAWFKKKKHGIHDEVERGLSLNARRYAVYSLLILGIVANLLLAFKWNTTVMISGYPHSIALLILLFAVGLIGCTSPVLFMPLMAIFPQEHLVSYLFGEGLGGLLPSIVALVQGIEDSSKDKNATTPSDEGDSYPRFSPTVYFIFIASLMLISTVSFFLLNNLHATKKVMIDTQTVLNSELEYGTVRNRRENEAYSSNRSIKLRMEDGQSCDIENISVNKPSRTKSIPSRITQQICYILIIQGWTCFFSSGFLPGVSTFSCLPYGRQPFHLAATLGAAIVPIACLFAFVKKHPPHIAFIGAISAIASLLSVYTILTASYSPTPPLVGTTVGEVLIVLNLVLYAGLSAYVKVNAAKICRNLEVSLSKENYIKEGSGRGPLFWCGAVSQCFAAFGAVLDFTLVTILKIFKSK